MTVHKVPDVGNCIFEALLLGLKANKADKGDTTAMDVRTRVCTHMRKFNQNYCQFWDELRPENEAKPCGDPATDKADRFLQYLKLLAVDRAWASDLEIAAASRTYDVGVVVWSPEQPPLTFTQSSGKGVIHLWLCDKHCEYLSGEPTKK